MTNDESTLSNVSGGNVADRSPRTCLLLEAYKVVPTDARYVSVRIKGTTIPVKNADEVLIWICKKMSVLQAAQLQRLMRVRKLGWLKATPGGMEKRYRIAYNCYVNLDGSGTTPLLRAAKLLEWLAWPRNDASITYVPPRRFIVQAHNEVEKEKRLEVERENVELRTYSYKYDQIEAVTGTDPVALFFKGDEYALNGKWTNLPAKICIALEKMWPGKLRELVADGNVPYMGISASGMRREQYVPEAQIYYEKNAASREFVRQTRSLCKAFGVDLAQVKVTYVARGETQDNRDIDQVEHIDSRPPALQHEPVKVEDVEKQLAEIPTDDFVRSLMIELLKQGRAVDETWDLCMSIPWCRREFGIRNALLRKLKIYESPSDYSMTYAILEPQEFSRYLILKQLDGFKRPAFMDWLQNLGVGLEAVCSLFEIAPPTKPEPIAEMPSAAKSDFVYPPPSEASQRTVVREADEPYVYDDRSRTIKEYIEQHPGCAKQQAVDELYAKGISKVLTRLDRHPEVIDINDRLYVKESISLFDETADILLKALDGLFGANGGYTSAHELYQTVQFDLDDFFYENDAFENEREIFDLCAYLFGKFGYQKRHHVFRGNMHIWRETPDYTMADCGLLIHWARLNGGVLTRQIGYENLERRGATETGRSAIFTLAMQKVKDKFWVLNGDEFLLKEGIEISTEFIADVKRQLDKLLALEESEDGLSFIPVGMIGEDFFVSLPPLPENRPWSIQLLQAVIEDHGDALRYKTIARTSFAGQSHAAIVPYGSECQDFSDLVYAAIKARSNKPSITYGRAQFIEFLKASGLYPEEMAGSSVESMVSGNGHFKWIDKNNLVVS